MEVRRAIDDLKEHGPDPQTFRKTVFPGSRRCPRSIKEFLENPSYRRAMEAAYPRARETARRVLLGVKRRGREDGEEMDERTEKALWPEILREAMVRELGRVAREVSMDRLEQRLTTTPRRAGIATVARGFLGDWFDAVKEDALRLATTGIVWLENLDDEYPALSEARDRLDDPPYGDPLFFESGDDDGVLDVGTPQAPLLVFDHSFSESSLCDRDIRPRLSLLLVLATAKMVFDYDGNRVELAPDPDTLLIWRPDLVTFTTYGDLISIRHWFFG